ncbi:MAG: hypothetical protein Q9225_000624 [Loekoesia sp. 1 TL-2023]
MCGKASVCQAFLGYLYLLLFFLYDLGSKATRTRSSKLSIPIRQQLTLTLLSMHLMYTLDANGKRIYTLKKVAAGEVTKSAHPARFSPDDKYSRFVYTFYFHR